VLADEMDTLSEVIAWHLERHPTWTPTSQAQSELLSEGLYSALPMQHPLVTVLLQPLQALGQGADHFRATAAIIRTPYTLLSLLTVMRTAIVASGIAYYLADPRVDVRERVRRSLNVDLESSSELMNFFQPGNEGFDRHRQRREDIAKGARALKFKVSDNLPRKGAKHWPKWYHPPKPPGDMEFAGMSFVASGLPETGDALFRLLSAAVHAQPHALTSLLRLDHAVRTMPGQLTVPLAVDGQRLIAWAATTAATFATQ
jgi:hypothetical protein